MRASLVLALLLAAARRSAARVGARAGLRRRAADARQGRMAARSGLDGTAGPRDAATTSRCCARCSAWASPKTCRSRPRLPITLNSGIYMPRGRIMAMMSSNQDLEAIVGWRFQRRAVGAGARLESTVFVGATAPLQEYRSDGMLAAPSIHASAASGLRVADALFLGRRRLSATSASATAIRWATASSTAPSMAIGRRSCASTIRSRTCVSSSKPSASTRHGDNITASRWSSSGGDSILVGPSALAALQAVRLEAGLLFPVYQQTNFQPEEKFRFGVNFTYFFWRK